MKKRMLLFNASTSLVFAISGSLFYFLYSHAEKASGVCDGAIAATSQQKILSLSPKPEMIEIPPVNLHPWVTLTCERNEDMEYFGHCVASAGDVNGDGFADVLIGNGRSLRPDFVKLYFGGISMDPTSSVNFTDPAPDPSGGTNCFGWSVAALGDINGDGFDDVIVGAYNTTINISTMAGSAYIFFGANEMHAIPDVILQGSQRLDSFGFSLAGTGDVNGDGYPDVLIGGPMAQPYSRGKAWLFYGGPDMDAEPAVIFYGESEGDSFGSSVSGAGDLNGDGYNDIIIGAEAFGGWRGKVYIYFGGPDMDNIPEFMQAGTDSDFAMGKSVSGAGDLNGDGYDDVAFGSPWAQDYTGRVYVLFGGEQLRVENELLIPGETYSTFGTSVSRAGDVNGDGYDDLVVGGEAYGADPSPNSFSGKVYLYFGGSVVDAAEDATLYLETPGACLGSVVSCAGDVNGDGLDDIIASEPDKYLGTQACRGDVQLILGTNYQPAIYIAGFMVEAMSENMIQLKIMALVSSMRETRSIGSVELFYDGLPTGILLNDAGLQGDDVCSDGIYTYECTFPASNQPLTPYLVEIVVADTTGRQSAPWPYVVVQENAPERAQKNHLHANKRLASYLGNNESQVLRTAGSNTPSILFWGTDSSLLNSSGGGLLSLTCIAGDPDGIQDIDRVEIYYQGIPTGIFMQLDEDASEFFPYCGLYSFQMSIHLPLPAGDYLLTAKAIDREGNESAMAPYLYLGKDMEHSENQRSLIAID